MTFAHILESIMRVFPTGSGFIHRTIAVLGAGVLLLAIPVPAAGQEDTEVDASSQADAEAAAAAEQDAETRALDSTATQWSFQFAYQTMPDYYDDTLADGSTRPPGLDNFVQLRVDHPEGVGLGLGSKRHRPPRDRARKQQGGPRRMGLRLRRRRRERQW